MSPSPSLLLKQVWQGTERSPLQAGWRFPRMQEEISKFEKSYLLSWLSIIIIINYQSVRRRLLALPPLHRRSFPSPCCSYLSCVASRYQWHPTLKHYQRPMLSCLKLGPSSTPRFLMERSTICSETTGPSISARWSQNFLMQLTPNKLRRIRLIKTSRFANS